MPSLVLGVAYPLSFVLFFMLLNIVSMLVLAPPKIIIAHISRLITGCGVLYLVTIVSAFGFVFSENYMPFRREILSGPVV